MKYQAPGRYRHGVWLVAKNGKGILTPRTDLPPTGSGYQYYWLGLHPTTTDVLTAAGKLNVPVNLTESTNYTSQIQRALSGTPTQIAGPAGFLQQLLQAAGTGVAIPGAGVGGAAADTGAAATTAGGAAAAGAGAGFFGTTAGVITDTVAFLALIAWIFHPRNILRAVEFITGIALMIFGLHAAMQARGERIEGFTTSEPALSRAGIGRVARELSASVARDNKEPRRRRIRPRSAPHVQRRTALRQRYAREESLSRRKEQVRRQTS